MTSDTQMYVDRCHIFNYYFLHSISVTKLCEQFNRSRTWFYKWLRRYELYGKEGLRNIDRSPPAMPNRTPLDIEMKILDFIITYPTYGPQRIANELTMQNVKVKPSAVYNVLKRYNFNTRKQRLEYMRIKNGFVVTPSDLERDRDKSKTRSLNTKYPGHIIGIDVFYAGTLKGIGRIFQFTANHSFERLLNELAIKHKLTKVRHPWTNGACERLNRTILEEFYQVSFRKTIYRSVYQLNDDLSRFIEFYNCQRTHQGKRTQGKVPAELYLLEKTKVA